MTSTQKLENETRHLRCEMSRFHDVETEQFLVLPGTNQDLQDLVRTMQGVYIEPLVFLEGVKHESRTWRIIDIPPTSVVAVTLSKHVFYLNDALKNRGCSVHGGTNTYFFDPRELETLLATSTAGLLADLAKAGLEHDLAKVYYSITGNAPYLC